MDLPFREKNSVLRRVLRRGNLGSGSMEVLNNAVCHDYLCVPVSSPIHTSEGSKLLSKCCFESPVYSALHVINMYSLIKRII